MLPGCATTLANGGYTVQPVPGPTSTNADVANKIKDGGIHQNLYYSFEEMPYLPLN